MVLPSGVVTLFDIFVVATPVRHAVRSAASALSSTTPPRCVLEGQHVPGHQHRVRGVVAGWPGRRPRCPDWVPIASSSGRSTAIVLVAGQYDAGGLGRASGQPSASDASKLSCGGLAGENSMPIASMIDLHRLLGDRPVRRSGPRAAARADRRGAGRSPCTSIAAHADGAVGEAELERRDPFERRAVFVDADFGIVLAQQRVAERDHRRQHACSARHRCDSVKRGELPSATQRMYAPAKQSACCSDTSVGRVLVRSARPGAGSRGRTRGRAPSVTPMSP